MKDHARQLLEKHIRKPFFAAQYAGSFQRMEPEAVQAGLSWLDQRFHLIRYEVCLQHLLRCLLLMMQPR